LGLSQKLIGNFRIKNELSNENFVFENFYQKYLKYSQDEEPSYTYVLLQNVIHFCRIFSSEKLIIENVT